MNQQRITELRELAGDRFNNDRGMPDDEELIECLDEIERLRAIMSPCVLYRQRSTCLAKLNCGRLGLVEAMSDTQALLELLRLGRAADSEVCLQYERNKVLLEKISREAGEHE